MKWVSLSCPLQNMYILLTPILIFPLHPSYHKPVLYLVREVFRNSSDCINYSDVFLLGRFVCCSDETLKQANTLSWAIKISLWAAFSYSVNAQPNKHLLCRMCCACSLPENIFWFIILGQFIDKLVKRRQNHTFPIIFTAIIYSNSSILYKFCQRFFGFFLHKVRYLKIDTNSLSAKCVLGTLITFLCFLASRMLERQPQASLQTIFWGRA